VASRYIDANMIRNGVSESSVEMVYGDGGAATQASSSQDEKGHIIDSI
jgi:hypothetical protein